MKTLNIFEATSYMAIHNLELKQERSRWSKSISFNNLNREKKTCSGFSI